jgi:hypothetical protein
MTEQQIIERIRSTTDIAVLTRELQRNRSTQDYLQALRNGEKQATADWLNSSSLFFPEDFVEEMKQLSLRLVPIEKRSAQLARIESALEEQLKKVRKN